MQHIYIHLLGTNVASISWEQERLLVTEVTNLIDIFNDGKASDRNQMVIVGFLQLRQKETQDTAAGTRMLRRRPTNCRRKTDLGAISQPPTSLHLTTCRSSSV